MSTSSERLVHVPMQGAATEKVESPLREPQRVRRRTSENSSPEPDFAHDPVCSDSLSNSTTIQAEAPLYIPPGKDRHHCESLLHPEQFIGPPSHGVHYEGNKVMPTPFGEHFLHFSSEELRFAAILNASGVPDECGGMESWVRQAARSVPAPRWPLGALPADLWHLALVPAEPTASISLDCAGGLQAAEALKSDADSTPCREDKAVQIDLAAQGPPSFCEPSLQVCEQAELDSVQSGEPSKHQRTSDCFAPPPVASQAETDAMQSAWTAAPLVERCGRQGGDDEDLQMSNCRLSCSLGRRRSVGPVLCTIHEGDEACAP